MDNAVVVGVGNIYTNESLFICGIHPLKLAKNLTRNQCFSLVNTIKDVLRKAIIQGGTTLKDFFYSPMVAQVILHKNYWYMAIKINLVQSAVEKLKV